MAGEPLKNHGIDITTVCIDFCTDEDRYINSDSHFIHIPKELYHDFLTLKSLQNRAKFPLFVAIKNSNKSQKGILFSKVEPSVVTSNSTHEMCLLPRWAIDKLELEDFLGKIDLIYVPIPQKVDYIKVKGNKSTYVKFKDIKSMLENKLSSYNCLNIEEEFKIEDVTFRVIELKNEKGIDINFGSTFETDVKIDFETPDDIAELERELKLKKELELKRELELKEEKKKLESQEKMKKTDIHHFGAHLRSYDGTEIKSSTSETSVKVFQSEGLKMTTENVKKLTKEEIIAARLKYLGNMNEK